MAEREEAGLCAGADEGRSLLNIRYDAIASQIGFDLLTVAVLWVGATFWPNK